MDASNVRIESQHALIAIVKQPGEVTTMTRQREDPGSGVCQSPPSEVFNQSASMGAYRG
jgi:hypothetical protein